MMSMMPCLVLACSVLRAALVSTVKCKTRKDTSNFRNDKYIYFSLSVHHMPYISFYSQGLPKLTKYTRAYYHVGNAISIMYAPANRGKLVNVSAQKRQQRRRRFGVVGGKTQTSKFELFESFAQ